MDFGCGTGLVGMNLLNEFNSMLFLDTLQNMINQIKQKITNFNIQNVDTLCFDIEKKSIGFTLPTIFSWHRFYSIFMMLN
ncbi:methyltransferase domain-containing protein [Neobacillus fumarioli]|uniref:methyltransferase domain-containing protein n=1 Tax=Neobacillus fumarioli TaxID=105229 RepID=UPI001F396649|nr:methyltransferase domain-containing protein [Neobacillus fumarioli]